MPQLKTVQQIKREVAQENAVREFKRDSITVSFVITNPKAVKFLRAAAGWQNQTESAYAKEILTDLLKDHHDDVEQNFEGRFGDS